MRIAIPVVTALAVLIPALGLVGASQDDVRAGLWRLLATPDSTFEVTIVSDCAGSRICDTIFFMSLPESEEFRFVWASSSLGIVGVVVSLQGKEFSLAPFCGPDPIVNEQCEFHSTGRLRLTNGTFEVDVPEEVYVGVMTSGPGSWELVTTADVLGASSSSSVEFLEPRYMGGVYVGATEASGSLAGSKAWFSERGGVLVHDTGGGDFLVEQESPGGSSKCLRDCAGVVVGPAGRYALRYAGHLQPSFPLHIAAFADIILP